jgi:hypothetical protein
MPTKGFKTVAKVFKLVRFKKFLHTHFERKVSPGGVSSL